MAAGAYHLNDFTSQFDTTPAVLPHKNRLRHGSCVPVTIHSHRHLHDDFVIAKVLESHSEAAPPEEATTREAATAYTTAPGTG